MLLEIPAGTLDIEGEGPVAAAHRELAEEVGLEADVLEPLGILWNSAGWSDERTHLFLARDTTTVRPPEGFLPKDEEAVMSTLWSPLEHVVRSALDGTITDAKTAIGVLRAMAVLREAQDDAQR
jgi:ADP-ribose pyrophosphatase